MARLVLALATLVLSSPAAAGNPYIGLDLGLAKARSNDIDELVSYVVTPSGVAPEALKYDDVFGIEYRNGHDVGVASGYDFGWFRLEGEVAHKRVGLKRSIADDITDQFLSELNGNLNRPSESPDPGAPGEQALAIADFQPSGSLKVGSAMVNTMFDFGVTDRLSFTVGGGLGRSFARAFGDHDGALAGQYMLGGRYALNQRVELGLKYRYFNSGVIKLTHDPIPYSGNPDLVTPGGVTASQTVNAQVAPDIEGEFRTRSLLLSLTYNWR